MISANKKGISYANIPLLSLEMQNFFLKISLVCDIMINEIPDDSGIINVSLSGSGWERYKIT